MLRLPMRKGKKIMMDTSLGLFFYRYSTDNNGLLQQCQGKFVRKKFYGAMIEWIPLCTEIKRSNKRSFPRSIWFNSANLQFQTSQRFLYRKS